MKKITIADIKKEYFGKIDALDLDLILAHVLKKPREFVMAHPEYIIPKLKIENCKLKIARRMREEPLAYILGYREFFGVLFLVSPATLVPRPETEMMVEMALSEISNLSQKQTAKIVDVGTGSGNIIISVAKNLEILWTLGVQKRHPVSLFGIDISNEALKIAKRNARINGIANQSTGGIKFIKSNLLEYFIKNNLAIKQFNNLIILANLPYLSQEIYNATPPNVKKYEPKSALYSPKEGLQHYEELLKQISKLNPSSCVIFLEISPEQKTKLPELIQKYLPRAKTSFQKDLAGKWRVCKIEVSQVYN